MIALSALEARQRSSLSLARAQTAVPITISQTQAQGKGLVTLIRDRFSRLVAMVNYDTILKKQSGRPPRPRGERSSSWHTLSLCTQKNIYDKLQVQRASKE